MINNEKIMQGQKLLQRYQDKVYGITYKYWKEGNDLELSEYL